MATQSVRIGWRPYVNPSITASSLWTSIYSVYNADAVGSTSLNTSLFAAYNGESNTNDSFGSNNGTAQGGLTYGTGKIGNAFQFNGTTSYVSLPNNSFNSLTNDFSVSFWMNLTNSHSADFGQLFSNLQTSIGFSTYFGFQIGFYNNQIYFTVGSNTGNSTASTRLVSNALSGYVGTWVHVICTHKQSTGYKIYVNGVLNNSNNGTYNPVYTTNHTPSIGAQYSIYTTPNLTYKLNGSMDALSVWSKELTQSEITELYNSGNGAQYIGDNFYKPTTNDALLVNNGTAQGGLTYGLGKVGTAFQFNGTNAYVALPNNSLNFTGDFSVSLWLYRQPLAGGMLVSNWYNGSTPYGWLIHNTNGVIRFLVGNGTSSPVCGFNSSLLTSYVWNFVTVTKTATSAKIYINGVLNNSASLSSSVVYTTTHYPMIGAAKYDTGSPTFLSQNGDKIDAVNVWNKELTVSEITELYNSGNGKQYVSSLDSDAQAFIASAAITVTTQQTAINTLVTDLKAANIWTKMKAIYPFVGGTAEQHRFNLKDPRTVNAAFYLDFIGGGTHGANGYKGNGSNGYANTFLSPSTNLTTNNIHYSYYNRTNVTEFRYDMGVGTPASSAVVCALSWFDNGLNRFFFSINSNEKDIVNSDPRKFFIANKTAAGSLSGFINTTKTTYAVTDSTPPAIPMFINARNLNGTNDTASSKECAFASIGDGLTDAEATAFYTAVQKYQTTLGRQV